MPGVHPLHYVFADGHSIVDADGNSIVDAVPQPLRHDHFVVHPDTFAFAIAEPVTNAIADALQVSKAHPVSQPKYFANAVGFVVGLFVGHPECHAIPKPVFDAQHEPDALFESFPDDKPDRVAVDEPDSDFVWGGHTQHDAVFLRVAHCHALAAPI